MYGPPSTRTPSDRLEERGPLLPPDLALARGVLYRALALGFRRPDQASLSTLVAPAASAALREAARLLEEETASAGGLGAAVEAVLARRPTDVDAAAARYDTLFGHAVRGRVCLYETEYGPGFLFQQPHALADLMGFYRAFGFEVRRQPAERADHVGCECEFMGLLWLKAAVLASPEPPLGGAEAADTREATAGAARRFLADHLGRVAPALAASLGREDPDGWYDALGRLLLRVVAHDAARLGVAIGPATLALDPVVDDATPMACEPGPALVQIQGLRARSQR
jgi:TorA maturation chaperone TorD